MQIRLNTDAHVQGDEALAAWVDAELKDRLARFRDHLTRIEVHLGDHNAARPGDRDKRCTLEARPAGRLPIAVSHDAGKVADAVIGATEKLIRALDSALGRARDAHGRESIRGEAG
jgi:hypothetical protein